jgi:hypothetical protein
MNAAALQRIKDRVTPTICETWGERGHGVAESQIEGRISAGDFDALCLGHEPDASVAVAAEREACIEIIKNWIASDRPPMTMVDDIRNRATAHKD